MSASGTMQDPGPLARFEHITAQADTMAVIVQRITDADAPETLRDIAKAWRIPLGKLAEWITEDRGRAEQYSLALKIAGEAAALDVLDIADAATPEDVAVRKLQVEARKWYSAKLSRERFGESTEIRHTGTVSLVAILSSMPKGDAGVGNVIEVTPEPESLPAPQVQVPRVPTEGLI